MTELKEVRRGDSGSPALHSEMQNLENHMFFPPERGATHGAGYGVRFLHFSNTMLVFSTVMAVFMVKPEEWTTNCIVHFIGSCLGYFGILIGLFHKLQLEGSGLAQGAAVNIAFIFTSRRALALTVTF